MAALASESQTPLQACLDADLCIIDGGLATELEAAGHNIANKLWSGSVLAREPAAISAVHAAYLAAGADVIISASYQLSAAGVANAGLGGADACSDLLRRSVELAVRARAEHMARTGTKRVPLIAASCGPLGAVYGDGSEYTGHYGLPGEGPVVPVTQELTPGRQDLASTMAFHRARLAVLAATPGVDLIAFETIPCLLEVRAIATLLAAEYHALRAWISVTCRDGETLSSGEPLAEAVRAAERVAPAQVVAFGVNCVHPAVVEGAIRTILAVERPAVAAAGGGDALVAGPARPRRKVVVYPNRGEVFDAATHCWVERPGPDPHSGMTPSERQFLDLAAAWARAGAWGIGGCCRTTPRLIAALRKQLKDEDGDGSAV